MRDKYEMDRFGTVAVAQWLLTALVILIVAVLVGITIWQNPSKDMPSWAVGLLNALLVAVALEWRNIVHATADSDKTETSTTKDQP
jgi:FtsH-binding integral membrane protein